MLCGSLHSSKAGWQGLVRVGHHHVHLKSAMREMNGPSSIAVRAADFFLLPMR
jgi:hypothetical protein